jgi:HSP20 family molecular chaperone IbpA
MAGVSKHDMHVSFRTNRIVVTWRRVRTVETIEDGVKVREKKEKQYSQMIPLPEGTQVCFAPTIDYVYRD